MFSLLQARNDRKLLSLVRATIAATVFLESLDLTLKGPLFRNNVSYDLRHTVRIQSLLSWPLRFFSYFYRILETIYD